MWSVEAWLPSNTLCVNAETEESGRGGRRRLRRRLLTEETPRPGTEGAEVISLSITAGDGGGRRHGLLTLAQSDG